ncbi:MAG: YgjV family protein [Halomonas sp.]|uniref:YgjV family protein n=1 Tax=Halomonas sp. TaxID=1486246 RepID=UPI002ACEE50B|nr:YgjV family protein [Halomonas sp.]MDZ7853257.1 YgjV family protein [Halomonas sp.]
MVWVIGVVACLTHIVALQSHTRAGLLRAISVALGLWSIHFAMLEAYETSAILLVGVAYNLGVAARPRRRVAAVALLLYLIGALMAMSLSGWVVAIGSTFFVVGGLMREVMWVRCFFLAGYASFAFNGMIVGSWIAVTNETLLSAGNLRAMYRDHKKRRLQAAAASR